MRLLFFRLLSNWLPIAQYAIDLLDGLGEQLIEDRPQLRVARRVHRENSFRHVLQHIEGRCWRRRGRRAFEEQRCAIEHALDVGVAKYPVAVVQRDIPALHLHAGEHPVDRCLLAKQCVGRIGVGKKGRVVGVKGAGVEGHGFHRES